MTNSYFETEPTREYLLSYTKRTEELLLETLTKLDRSSKCRIYPSLDLGFPYDVIRLVGGFPTGCINADV